MKSTRITHCRVAREKGALGLSDARSLLEPDGDGERRRSVESHTLQKLSQRLTDIDASLSRKQKRYSELMSGPEDSKVTSEDDRMSRKVAIEKLQSDICELKKVRRKLITKLETEQKSLSQSRCHLSADSLLLEHPETFSREDKDSHTAGSFGSLSPLPIASPSTSRSRSRLGATSAWMSPEVSPKAQSAQVWMSAIDNIVLRRVAREQAAMLQGMVVASLARAQALRVEISRAKSPAGDERSKSFVGILRENENVDYGNDQGGQLFELQEELDVGEAELDLLQRRLEEECVRAGCGGADDLDLSPQGILDNWSNDKEDLLLRLRKHYKGQSTDLLSLVIHFVSLLLDTKFRIEKEGATSGLLELRCEELETRNKAVQTALRRCRADVTRRLEAMRQEAEEKTGFLVQQLRESEGRARAAEERLRTGASSKDSGRGRPVLSVYTEESEGDNGGDGDDDNDDDDVGSHTRSGSGSTQKPSSKRNLRNMDRSRNTGQLGGERQGWDVQQSTSTSATPVVSQISSASELSVALESLEREREKLDRRWRAEKQRREQLEKRNGELARDLRSLRELSIRESAM